jgi:hypothetical protein
MLTNESPIVAPAGVPCVATSSATASSKNIAPANVHSETFRSLGTSNRNGSACAGAFKTRNWVKLPSGPAGALVCECAIGVSTTDLFLLDPKPYHKTRPDRVPRNIHPHGLLESR